MMKPSMYSRRTRENVYGRLVMSEILAMTEDSRGSESGDIPSLLT